MHRSTSRLCMASFGVRPTRDGASHRIPREPLHVQATLQYNLTNATLKQGDCALKRSGALSTFGRYDRSGRSSELPYRRSRFLVLRDLRRGQRVEVQVARALESDEPRLHDPLDSLYLGGRDHVHLFEVLLLHRLEGSAAVRVVQRQRPRLLDHRVQHRVAARKFLSA